MRQQISLSCLAMLPLMSLSFSGVRMARRYNDNAFSSTTTRTTTSTQLYGLFDGVKDAFSAPTLERSQIDAERETPIDRWMGWSVASENKKNNQMKQQMDPANFVDAMDSKNYITVELAKPMGIVFEENDADFGGIFVHSLKEDGVAAKQGNVKVGDQLVAVATKKVSGLPFDDALSAIIDSTDSTAKLLFFRGTADQFYGPTGASQEWLNEFVGGGVPKPPVVPAVKPLEVVVVDTTSTKSS